MNSEYTLPESKPRCDWVPLNKPFYVKYHDEEWGVPLFNEQKMFEYLVLETFQAGLSWEIILNKRENFRSAFDSFIPEKIAEYGDKKIQELRLDKGIVRNRLKISATVNNAQKYLETAKEFGSFVDYIWSYVDGKPIINQWRSISEIPAKTLLSDRISKEMKARGFKFFGTTVCYAHMQAVGMVNDHTVDCFRYGECSRLPNEK